MFVPCHDSAHERSDMLPLIDKRRSEIASLCRRFHVRRLDVFGSGNPGR
jgi:hypothetical protein